jgi:hypothetical protein
MASMVLKYSWLKSIDTPLFTVCVVICIETSNVDAVVPEGSSPCAVYWCVLCGKVFHNNAETVIAFVEKRQCFALAGNRSAISRSSLTYTDRFIFQLYLLSV